VVIGDPRGGACKLMGKRTESTRNEGRTVSDARQPPRGRSCSHMRVMRAAMWVGVLLLLSLGWASGCNLLSASVAPLPSIPRGVCFDTQVAQCDQTCQDNNVGSAVDNAGLLLYNQSVAGMPAGSVNNTASCPLGGTVAVAGSISVASNGVVGTQLTFTLMNCGVSAASYSLTFTGALQMR